MMSPLGSCPSFYIPMPYFIISCFPFISLLYTLWILSCSFWNYGYECYIFYEFNASMVKAELQNIGHEKSYRLIELGTVSLKLQRADKDSLQS